MSVPIVVDLNFSVEWVAELARHGWTAVHWSTIGDPPATTYLPVQPSWIKVKTPSNDPSYQQLPPPPT
jgi:hypothetical protein